jgi:hypothetical protein
MRAHRDARGTKKPGNFTEEAPSRGKRRWLGMTDDEAPARRAVEWDAGGAGKGQEIQ